MPWRAWTPLEQRDKARADADEQAKKRPKKRPKADDSLQRNSVKLMSAAAKEAEEKKSQS
ncbi:hypothetical protein O5624_02340 [Escherichia coli]|nr:hypothetical protein [Escherichia coli]